MKILSRLLILAGMVFCIMAFNGHKEAWPAIALCFFATIMIVKNR